MDSTNSEPVNPSVASIARELPHNTEAEQALLGAILINNRALERVESLVTAEDFYDGIHQQIWDVVTERIARGLTADPVTLSQVFEAAPPILPTLTVPQYLGRLVVNATSLINLADYAKLIHDLAVRRSIIGLGEIMISDAHTAEASGEQQIEQAEQYLSSIADCGRSEIAEVAFSEVARSTLDYANAAYMRDGALAGLSTGLVDLDNKLGGLVNGNLLILAGRPSMGKSALATNIAVHNAKKWLETGGDEGAPVLFFSLEMSRDELGMRILGEEASIPSEKIRRGTFEENDFRRLAQAESAIRDMPLWIDAEGGLSLARLVARARRVKRKRGLGLLIVDYLQLMAGSSRNYGQNRTQEVTDITVGLKAAAKELNVPVVALSQLSRKVEERVDKRPQLADLRESGSIEQDADVVMFVFREEYYVEREKPPTGNLEEETHWETRMREVAGKGEIILGKQRHGPTGSVPVAWDGALTRFSNLARGHQ
jgi:replicative DNA helicase